MFPAWPAVGLAALVVVRAAVYATALLVSPWVSDPNRIIPAWAQLCEALLFASQAALLLYFGWADRRAWALGVFILDAACTLVEPYVRSIPKPNFVIEQALHIRTDAFQAAMLWFFAGEFPRATRHRVLGVWFRGFTVAAFLLGASLALLNVYAALTPTETASLFGRMADATRRDKTGFADWYFAPQFLLLLPLIVLMPLKLRESGADDRRRFRWLLAGIGLGFAPLMFEVFLASLWPAYAQIARPYLPIRAVLILGALTLIPTSAAYAALVQRTLDLRLVVRAAIQYVFARSVVTVLAAAPVAAVAYVVFINKDERVGALMAGPTGLVLAALSVVGIVAAISRRSILNTIDARFFRDRVDARQALIDLAESVRRASSVFELSQLTRRSVERALHPSVFAFAVAGQYELHAQDAALAPLSVGTALMQLISRESGPLVIDQRPGSIIARLTKPERIWLQEAQARLLVPLRGAVGQLLGTLVLGEKKSELPYDAEDRALLNVVADACGLTLDRILSGDLAGVREASDQGPNPSAAECVQCGRLHDSTRTSCDCGGLLQRASVPLILDDRLRFQKRIGAGGMGLVYRATDLRLRQPRAVKTLPRVEAAAVSRMHREARTMAAVSHPNVAILHGLEMWRGVPLLVMEFLDGGTLASQLLKSPLEVESALKLALDLAEGLDSLHSLGLIHRDIKPSNIGFSASGVPKLLDFGLAKLMPADGLSADSDTTTSALFVSEPGRARGTPAYLSPEVLTGEPPAPRDDVWSLSLTLLESITTNNPFRSSSVPATIGRVLYDRQRLVLAAVAGLPVPLQELFRDLLGPVSQRPQTARQFIARVIHATKEGR